ncbi:MAG: 50S ribosomal protein L3 [Deltaproteobacteria bacterium]|nr:50S ribosomal protein L3 [Deltaproteobacteria bacterium]
MAGFIGEKLGMTQIFDEEGLVVPVTIVKIKENVVVSLKTKESDGYNAVQIGYGKQKESRLNKPKLGHFKKGGVDAFANLKEFRTDNAASYKVGMAVDASAFKVGDILDVQGRGKGKGFQGVMKRYHFAGGCDSHGNSVSHRVPGSIGQNTFPGKVIKGKKLPGHMGSETVTVKNIKVVGVEEEQGLILVKGAIPGSKNSIVNLMPKAGDFESRFLEAKEEAQAS